MFHAVLIMAGVSAATTPILGTTPYSAYEVEPDQTIKMRVDPTEDARIVAEIPNTADDITLTGSFGGRWTEVRFAGQTGWVRDRDIGLGKPGRFQVPGRVDCSANDAEWSFHLAPAIVALQRRKETGLLVVIGAHEDPADNGRLVVTLRSPTTDVMLPIVFERAGKHAINVAMPTANGLSNGSCPIN